MNQSKKVCIIGLDGLSLDNLVILLEKLNLPHIRSIIKSCSASPKSLPPLTPIVWNSIFTGVNPGKHGIFGFKKAIKYNGLAVDTKLVSSADIKYPRIFEMLGMLNFKSIVINVPLTYPFEEIVARKNMIIVSDWLAPNQKILPYNIEKKYKQYLIHPPHNWGKEINTEKYINKIENYLDLRMNIYLDLLDAQDWDLYTIVFSEVDWILHKVPHIIFGEKLHMVKPTLELIDKFIANALKNCDMIALVSDHGFDIKTILFNPNALFIRKGLLKYEHTIDLGKLVKKRKKRKSRNNSSDTIVKNSRNIIFNQLLIILRKLISISQILNERYNNLFAMGLNKLIKSNLDYNKSIAIMVEPMSWGVYVKKNYEKKVSMFLNNNLKGIKKVIHAKEIFNGPYVKDGPDLMVIPEKQVLFSGELYSDVYKKIFVANHSNMALLSIVGKGIKKYKFIRNAAHYDLVPTILYYMNLPVPINSDGRVLIEIFEDTNEPISKSNYLLKFKLAKAAKVIKRKHKI